VASLVGEATEMSRFIFGGMAVPLRLATTLLAGHVVLALIAFVLGRLLTRGRRSLTVAAALFGMMIILPQLNFYYLPQILSARSLLGNAAAALAIVVLASVLFSQVPRAATVTLLALAVAVNGAEYLRGHAEGPRHENEQSRPKGPNILVVLIDSLRADHLGLYGYKPKTSPHLDTLAETSLVFDRAISQASWTKPSVASILTGQYLHRHGVNNKWDALGPKVQTLGGDLQGLGYRTAAFSSNPFVAPEFGFHNGFDFFFHTAAPSGVQYTTLFRLLTRLKALLVRTTGLSLDLPGLIRKPAEKFPSNYARDEMLTTDLIGWLQRHRDERFFVYAHFIGPHIPYDPPADYVAPFLPAGWSGGKPPTDHPTQARLFSQTAVRLSALQLGALVAQYDGAIAWTDMLIGRLLDAMREFGLMDQTLLVVTADHGEEFYDHNNWGHGLQMYNELIHIPLLIHFPAVIAAGKRSDPVMLVDLYPTIAAFAGARPAPERLDGQGLFDHPATARARVYSEYYRHDGSSPYKSLTVLEGGMKLIETHDEAARATRVELFDLAHDWEEKRNLTSADQAAADQETHHLEEALAAFGKEGPKLSSTTVKIDAETKERLRALGYH
jgi:arylsulfatase A-like enzyme